MPGPGRCSSPIGRSKIKSVLALMLRYVRAFGGNVNLGHVDRKSIAEDGRVATRITLIRLNEREVETEDMDGIPSQHRMSSYVYVSARA